ncbi:hypothetical protein N0V90_000901 [Kalmusia sp. IMI 367209]|nr:hypothetical protein N0V90_000901 [Kalmusia sp. IMI 367209]
MQTAATRRAFSQLASKIHPQLPLTPRESQQLLNLLTTSFRTHLDREYPVGAPESPLPSSTTQIAKVEQDRRVPSSYNSASDHIDSILSNPLFARKPRRRGSESAAVEVLKDPLSWFLDQVAIGTADIPKAILCLGALKRSQQSPLDNGRRPASIIAGWLHASGQETSSDFLAIPLNMKGAPRESLVTKLVPMLLAEGNQAPLWRWFTYKPEQDTGSISIQNALFRQRLLKSMVNAARNRDEAFAIFLRAYRIMQGAKHDLDFKILQVAGGRLVDMIVADPKVPCTTELYEAFALSIRGWLWSWSKVVESMLCLCHPTQPNAQPGLAFIKDPKGAIRHINVKKSKQRFLVRMCLGVAQQLIEEERFSDAQVAMEFTKEHFAELVLVKLDTTTRKVEEQEKIDEEKKNIAMLDRLLLT